MQAASAHTKTFGKSIQNGITNHAPAIRATGLAIAGLGAAMTGVAVLSVKAAIDLEKQMANVSTMLDGLSMNLLPAYTEGLREMSKEFGESTDTLSKGLYDILSASIAPAKALDVLAVSAKAATAGLTDTGVAADAITTIINSYGMAAEDAGKISDILFATVKRGKLTFNELAPSIGKVAATASIAGVPFEELGASIATITRAGIRSQEAMTAINGILRAFLKPTDDAAAAAKEFGFELNTNTLRTIGLQGVLELLKDATAEQTAAMFPNIRGLKGIAAQMKDVEGFGDDLDLMYNSLGLTEEAFIKQSGTLAFTIEQLKQEFKDIFVTIGNELLPIIKNDFIPLIKNVAKHLVEWAKKFAELSPGIKKFLLVLGPLLIAIGGLIVMLPTLAPIIALLLGPVGLIIAAIVAAAAAFIYFYNTNEKFRAGVQKTGAYLEFFGRIVFEIFKTIGTNIGNFLGWLVVEFPNAFRDVVSAVATIFTNLGKNIGAWVSWLGKKLNPKNWLKEIEKPDWTPFLEGFESTMASFPELVGFNLDKARTVLKERLAGINTEFQGTGKVIKEVGEEIEKSTIDWGKKWDDFFEAARVKVRELTEEEKKRLEEIAEATRELFQEIFELTHTRTEIEQKAFDERIEQLRELGVEEELIQKLIAARNAKIQEEITAKEKIEKDKRLAKAKEDADKIIALEQKVADKIFELTHFKEEIAEKAFNDYIDGLRKAGISEETIYKLRLANYKKIEEEKTLAIIEEEEKRIKAKDEVAEAEEKRAKEKVDKIIALEQGITDEIFKLTHFKEEIAEKAFNDRIANLRKEGVSEEKIYELRLAHYIKIEKEQTSVVIEEGEKRIKAKDEMAAEEEKRAKEKVDKIIALEQGLTDKIFELTHFKEEIAEKAFNDYIDGLRKEGVSEEKIYKFRLAHYEKIEKEKTLVAAEEGNKRLDQVDKDAEATEKREKEKAKKIIALEQGVTDEIFKLTHFKEEIAEKAFNDYIDGLRKEGVSEEKIYKFRLAHYEKIEEEKTKVDLKEANERVEIAEKEADKKTKEAKKTRDERIALEEEVTDKIFKLTHTREEIAEKEFDDYIDMLRKRGISEKKIIDLSVAYWKEHKGNWKSLTSTMKAVWGEAWEDIGKAGVNTLVDIINGAKKMGEALAALAVTMQQIISDILMQLAVKAAQAGDAVSAALLLVGAVIIRVAGAISDLITGMGNVKRAIEENFEDLAIMFEEVGASMHATIEAAEADIARLIASTADVEMSTREKLIKELDQYYDYRNLKEMELAELMELAEETKRRIQEETLEEVKQITEQELQVQIDALNKIEEERILTHEELVKRKELEAQLAEIAAEEEAKRTDEAIGGLDAITKAYERELEMIARKITLFRIEILLLRAKGEAEWGNKVAAKKYREEAQKMMEDLQAEIEATTAALERETKAHKEGGTQTKTSEKEKQQAIEDTRKVIEDLGESTVESMDRTANEMVSAIQSMAQGIVMAIQDMTKQIVKAISSMVNVINDKLKSIPDRVDFDIIGKLRMPEIPSIGRQYFDIIGKYQAPSIPSAQTGIPYIPRDMPIFTHREEAVLNPSQARKWRRGQSPGDGGTSGGITVNVPRGAVVIYGDIRTKADVEELREVLGRDLGEQIAKQLPRTVPL